MRPTIWFLQILLLTALFLLGLLTAVSPAGVVIAQNQPTATVNSGALNVRSGPGVSYGSTAVIYRGTLVQLLGRNDSATWAKVRLTTGHEGWVNASLLQTSTAIGSLPVVGVPAVTASAVVNSGALNVRSGPGVAYSVVTVSQQGHVVALLGRTADSLWAKVRVFDGREGWVNASLIILSVPISSLPALTAPPTPQTAVASILSDQANIRTGPGTSHTIITISLKGHVVALLGRTADSLWAKVRVFDGREGWVNANLLAPNVAISSLPVANAPAPPVVPSAVVATGALNVRSGPGVNFGVVTVSQQGHVVALLGRTADSNWAKVRVFDGREGWVNASLITPNVPLSGLPVIGTTAAATAVVSAGALNVRYGPGVGFGAFTVVYSGQTVQLLGRNGTSTWAQIRAPNGQTGWVNAALVVPNVTITTLPITG